MGQADSLAKDRYGRTALDFTLGFSSDKMRQYLYKAEAFARQQRRLEDKAQSRQVEVVETSDRE